MQLSAMDWAVPQEGPKPFNEQRTDLSVQGTMKMACPCSKYSAHLTFTEHHIEKLTENGSLPCVRPKIIKLLEPNNKAS